MKSIRRRITAPAIVLATSTVGLAFATVVAHPLGTLAVNHSW